MHPDTPFIFIPIALFFSIAYAIKAIADASARGKMAAMSGSPELVRAILHADDDNRRMAGLRWGVVLVFFAAGLGVIEFGGWDELTPGVLAILVGATGAGNLLAFAAVQALHARSRTRHDPSI